MKTNIERSVFKLLKVINDIHRLMPKDYKHTLGARLIDNSLELYSNSVDSYYNKSNRINSLKSSLIIIYKLSSLLKLSHELKLTTDKLLIESSELLNDISIQSNNWLLKTYQDPEFTNNVSKE